MKIKICSIILLACLACNTKKSNKTFDFKSGNFISYLENKKDSSVFYREKGLQIETYKNKTDTFEIIWKDKFEFHLQKTNPNTKLDSTNFRVKITKIKDNAYDFEAGYENSNFKQKGSTYKISD